MSNERLRAAVIGAGITPSILAEVVGVDPKTVQRWILSDRIPHRVHRLAAAAALGRDEVYLWPATEADPQTKHASQAEFVAMYPNRGSVAISTWVSLLAGTSECLDIIAFAGDFLHDSVPDFAARVAAKARQGVAVRLAFADPDCDAVRKRGEEEGIGELLAARCRLMWSYLAPVLATPGVQGRMHDHALSMSMFRFDDTLFVNTHIYAASAGNSPIVHLERRTGGRIFDQYMLGFDRTWERAGAPTGRSRRTDIYLATA